MRYLPAMQTIEVRKVRTGIRVSWTVVACGVTALIVAGCGGGSGDSAATGGRGSGGTTVATGGTGAGTGGSSAGTGGDLGWNGRQLRTAAVAPVRERVVARRAPAARPWRPAARALPRAAPPLERAAASRNRRNAVVARAASQPAEREPAAGPPGRADAACSS